MSTDDVIYDVNMFVDIIKVFIL